jgi:DNA-binding transcriptional LysR family regulator
LRRLQLGRDEVRAIAKASSETLRFASTHVLSLTFFPLWLRQLENAHPFSATVELTADNMVACERLMVEGRAQFLLCHHHEAATTRFGSDFRSIRLGEDVLLPVATPGLLSDESAGALPQLCFTADSGMGRILGRLGRRRTRTALEPDLHLSPRQCADRHGARWTASPGPRKVWSRTIWQAAGWYAPARRTMTFPSKSGYGARRRGNRRRPKHSGPGFSRRILPRLNGRPRRKPERSPWRFRSAP